MAIFTFSLHEIFEFDTESPPLRPHHEDLHQKYHANDNDNYGFKWLPANFMIAANLTAVLNHSLKFAPYVY